MSAEGLLQELEEKEKKLGPENLEVAETLHLLGLCVLDTKGPAVAQVYFKRALKIEQASLILIQRPLYLDRGTGK